MLAYWLAEHHEEVTHAAEAAHGAAEHAEAHGSKVPELPNLLGVVHHALYKLSPDTAHQMDAFAERLGFSDPLGTPFTALETAVFGFVVVAFLIIFFLIARSKLQVRPVQGKKMAGTALLAEILYVFFEDFFGQIMDKKAVRQHLWFIGTLFIYIFCCNTLGLLFLGKAPTANLSFNLALAACVFVYVHGRAILISPVGYLKHFPGALPTMKEMGGMGLFLIPFLALLFTIIHVMELMIQPASLSLRLYGNLLGKDVLLGVFSSLLPYVPLHTPFMLLGLLLGTIQALIFSLLAAVYIMMWEPHTDHGHDEHHDHEGQHAHAGGHA